MQNNEPATLNLRPGPSTEDGRRTWSASMTVAGRTYTAVHEFPNAALAGLARLLSNRVAEVTNLAQRVIKVQPDEFLSVTLWEDLKSAFLVPDDVTPSTYTNDAERLSAGPDTPSHKL